MNGTEPLLYHCASSEVEKIRSLIHDRVDDRYFAGIHITDTVLGALDFCDIKSQLPFHKGQQVGNRLCLFYSDVEYSYSGVSHDPFPLPDLPILNKIQNYLNDLMPTCDFNSFLAQEYQADSSLNMHNDNERSISKSSWILGISFGNNRYMGFCKNSSSKIEHKCLPKHGDIIMFSKASQFEFKHGILPSLEEQCGPRISFTLRLLNDTTSFSTD